ILWSVIEGLVAIALLLAGGLNSLQAAALATALPFSVILLLMSIATLRALRVDDRVLERAEREERIEKLTEHVTSQWATTLGEHPEIETYVDDRIDYRITRTRGLFNQRPRKRD